VLEQYGQAIEAERLLTERGRPPRRLSGHSRLRRTLRASPGSVWARWTSAEKLIRRLVGTRATFTVVECEVDAVPGGNLRIVMEEGDGTRYVAGGRYVALCSTRLPSPSSLPPLALDGEAALLGLYTNVRFAEAGASTKLSLTIEVTDNHNPDAAPPWQVCVSVGGKLLDNLARNLREAKLTTARTPPFPRRPPSATPRSPRFQSLGRAAATDLGGRGSTVRQPAETTAASRYRGKSSWRESAGLSAVYGQNRTLYKPTFE